MLLRIGGIKRSKRGTGGAKKSNREKLIEILSCKVHPREGIDPAVVVANYLMDNDIVSVVRCRDCKYVKNAKITKKGYRICPASRMEIVDYDFCSYGEREDKQ